MLRQELVRTVASRQMQLVGLPHNVQRVRRVSREVKLLSQREISFSCSRGHDLKLLKECCCLEDNVLPSSASACPMLKVNMSLQIALC